MKAVAMDMFKVLRCERIVTIIVGNEERQQTFFIQEALLRYTSKGFFAALDHKNLKAREADVLKFPEDSVDAWEVLLLWIYTKVLPEENFANTSLHDKETLQVLLVHCWLLGDKFQLVDFQDLVMIELLDLSSNILIAFQAAEDALCMSTPRSPLHRLFLRLIVSSVFANNYYTMEDFDCVKDLDAHTPYLLRELHLWHTGGWWTLAQVMVTRFGRTTTHMREYLLGIGPGQQH